VASAAAATAGAETMSAEALKSVSPGSQPFSSGAPSSPWVAMNDV